MDTSRPVAVTMGDPAGIGGEIAMLAWSGCAASLPPFFLLDDPERLRGLADKASIPCPVETITDVNDVEAVFGRALPVLPLSRPIVSGPGNPLEADAAMTVEALERAVDQALSGCVSGVVTGPITKSRLYAAGFPHPGHTEYLGRRAGLQHSPVMMLASPMLKVVPVTIHLALREAIGALTTDRILRVLRITAEAMVTDFGLDNARIAVAGINPHAGEKGHLGTEELEIIEPAISALMAEGIPTLGPLPSDTMFHEEARRTYDVAVCMYHDQALIPLKTLGFHEGVNVTLGLPFVRTSPDHGTAYDIAGTGTANPSSFVSALRMASEIAQQRQSAMLTAK